MLREQVCTAELRIELLCSLNYSANMQNHDWNDLKYFLALYRAGKLSKAAAITGKSETTVSRRVRALEEKIGTSLFRQSGIGRYEPTDSAFVILAHAEAVELENTALQEKLGTLSDSVTGTVRVSSVPLLVNRFLVPHLGSLIKRYSQLNIDLVPASENFDLTKREADIAVRFARPKTGGNAIKARKLGELKFGIYGPNPGQEYAPKTCGWIRYDEGNSSLPQADWLEAICRNPNEEAAAVRVADAETALEAVANGLGKTLLPRLIAYKDARLSPLPVDGVMKKNAGGEMSGFSHTTIILHDYLLRQSKNG